jgi:putative flippase GtrA
MIQKANNLIIQIIDFFHPPFSRWIPKRTFRYLACGGGTTLLGLFLYFVLYNYVFQAREVTLTSAIHLKPYIAAYIFSACVTIPLGFALSKYVVFQESNLKGHVQLFRYGVMTATCFLLNYPLLHFFVGVCHIWATPSQTLTTILIAIFSYFSQRHFTFRTKNKKVAPPPTASFNFKTTIEA